MRSRGGKPRVNHVRTGCITCKRRRVKCSEEKPHCNRCIRAGFICAGYNVPKAWLFESNSERTTTADTLEAPVEGPLPLEDAHVSSSHQRASITPYVSLSSPLQHGNSDPFHVYAVHVGPRENFLLQINISSVLPLQYPINHGYQEWVHPYSENFRLYYAESLENDTTAYGLFARNAAIEAYLLRGRRTQLDPTVLSYLAQTQACLRRMITVNNEHQTVQSLQDIVSASGFLAAAEGFLNISSLEVHLRAMNHIMVQHAKLLVGEWHYGKLIGILYLGVVRAVLDFKRSPFDTSLLLPQLSENMWSSARATASLRRVNNLGYVPHRCVTNTKLRTILLHQMLQVGTYNDTLHRNPSQEIRKLLRQAVGIEELLHYAQLLDIALDATEALTHAAVDSPAIQDQFASTYISVAALLWIRLTSPTTLTHNAVHDTAPSLLKRLRELIVRSEAQSRAFSGEEPDYTPAKLWVSYIGLNTELERNDRQGLDPVCGKWFFEAFRNYASSMHARNWQDAVDIFKHFLYSDFVEPHISIWWEKVTSEMLEAGRND